VLDGWLGGGASSVIKEDGTAGTVALGLTGLYYHRWLEVGLGYTAEAALFYFTTQVPGLLAGVKLDPVPWLRFDLLAESGASIVSRVGSGLFVKSLQGDDAALPYLGGKASVSVRVVKHRVLIGWWVNAGEAMRGTTLNPTVETCFLGCSVSQQTFTFGGESWSMGLRIGGDLVEW
jgi:hypothetical protein